MIIETLELLRDRDNTICRIRSKDGVVGVAVGHSFIAKSSYPMFNLNLREFFLGKDARDLDQLIYNGAELNVKRQGIPLDVQIAVIEFASLDMLGNMVDKPAGQLIGDAQNKQVPIYLGHWLWELRNKEPEESLELMYRDYLKT